MLARLGLDPSEEEFYAEQLSRILEPIDRLAAVDTDAIPPTAQVVELDSALREDQARPCLDQNDAIANAPAARDGFFVVKTIQDADPG